MAVGIWPSAADVEADLGTALLGSCDAEEEEDIDDDDSGEERPLAAPLLNGTARRSAGAAAAAPAGLPPPPPPPPPATAGKAPWGSSSSSSGSSWLLGKSGSSSSKRKARGACPICGQPVRSGQHFCAGAERTLREGQLSDAARAEGNALFRAGRHAEAVAAYSKALEHGPGDPKLWSNRAAAYTRLGEYAKAIADCDAAIRLAPSWPKGYMRKALALERCQQWEAAAAAYEALLRAAGLGFGAAGPGKDAAFEPDDPDLADVRRRLLVARSRHATAVRVSLLAPPFCAEAVEARWQALSRAGAPRLRNDSECRARLEAGEALKTQGNEQAKQMRWEAAEERYRRALDTITFCPPEPSKDQAKLEATLKLNLALCHEHAKRHQEAADLCTNVLALEPTNVKARFRRAAALGELQDFDAALEDIDVAVALQCRDAALLALRRRLLEQRQALRRREKAQCARMFEGG